MLGARNQSPEELRSPRPAVAPARRRWDPWLLASLSVITALGLYQIDWGLAVGTSDWMHSWTVDAMEPLTALGIVHKSFSSWNSGWFYFKYPLGYPLIVTLAEAPYLALLFVTHDFHRLSSTYPYGFAKPEHALFVLAIIQRLLNVAFTATTVALVYGIGRRLFGKRAGYLAAWFAAVCYPVVYYAHTSNVDASYTCWLVLAMYCAIVASESTNRLPWVGLGFAAAMAMATKEQAFGYLLPLPLLALARRQRAEGTARVWWGPSARVMALSAIATVIVADNLLVNPLGLVARLAFLAGHPLAPVNAPLKPVEFAWFKGAHEWIYLKQFWDALDSGLGTPFACLAVLAVPVVTWRTPRAAAWLLASWVGYYYLSLRGQQLITLRYSLPLLVLAIIIAAALLEMLYAGARHGVARAVAVLLVAGLGLLALGRGIELTSVLRHDSRRQAEAWMRIHLPDGARGETYQKPTYLPRFRRRLEVNQISMDQRSISAFQSRQPDFVVLSSASRKSISHVWNPDWRTTRTLLLEVPEASRFVDALRRGTLGYHRVARFSQKPRLLRVRTTGLCPEITIYARDNAPAEGKAS